jgi:radical SAM superfamily enzyme YgiQ (UPF0313 family)
LAYISAVLKQAGYQVHCLDLTHVRLDQDVEVVKRAVRDYQCGIVGVGGLSRDFNRMLCALNAAGEEYPDIVKVVGGGGVSSDPEFTLEALGAHYGVIGEGEDTVLELAQAIIDGKSPNHIHGLVYRDVERGIVQTERRNGTKDLDNVPLPDYDGLGLSRYLDAQKPYSNWVFDTYHDTPRYMPVVFSRSCPFKCTFCYHAISKYRTRSLDCIFKELVYLVEKYDINTLAIFDDLFAVKRDRIEEFCRRIKPMQLLWSCQLRVNTVNDELLRLMKDAGCYSISYGFESISESVLLSMKKKVSPDEIKVAARETYKNMIDVTGNFICGDPAENYESLNETVTWWANHPQYGINIGTLQTYPGAEIYHYALEKGIIADRLEFLRNGCPDVNLTGISPDEWDFFVRSMLVAQRTARIPAHILDAQSVKVRNEDRLAITVVCPHCGESVKYGNLPYGDIRVICKRCYSRLDIPFSRFIGRRQYPEANTPILTTALEILAAGLRNKDGEAVSRANEIAGLVWSEKTPDPDVAHLIGVSLLICNALPMATEFLRVAVRLSPDDGRIHSNLAATYLAQGMIGWGYLHARYSQMIEPHLPEAAHNLREAENAITDKDHLRFIPAGDPIPKERLQVALPQLSVASKVSLRLPLRWELFGHPDDALSTKVAGA